MGILFKWDPKKARLNIKTHSISFDEASTAFRGPVVENDTRPIAL